MAEANYMVLEARRQFNGPRHSVEVGERRTIRFGYEDASFVPRIVAQVRAGEQIDWGGATVHADGYAVLFDGKGPLPAELRQRTAASL